MNIGIIGHGFVGLACETGLQSICDVRVYDKYKETESLDSVVENCKIIFLCLPTPMNEDGSCDTSIIEDTTRAVNRLAKSKRVLVLKSTVPPGTTEKLSQDLKKHAFIFNPEFLREKTFIQDFLEQDRIILGRTKNCDMNSYNLLMELYDRFIKAQKTPGELIYTDSTTAEMVKYTTNCFLATKLSFLNEIYDICQHAGINYKTMAKIFLKDSRIGKSHWQVPGHDGDFGWGGKCFYKDLNALLAYAKQEGIDPTMLRATNVKNLMVRKNHDWLDIPGATYKTGYKK